RLPVADTDRAAPARRSKLVAGDPASPRLEVVQPRKALCTRGVGRIGLGLGVHLLGVPADKHQELHVGSLQFDLRPDMWTTSAAGRNRHACIDARRHFGDGADEGDRPYPTAARTSSGAASASCLSGVAPRASLMVENARRNAINAVASKISR